MKGGQILTKSGFGMDFTFLLYRDSYVRKSSSDVFRIICAFLFLFLFMYSSHRTVSGGREGNVRFQNYEMVFRSIPLSLLLGILPKEHSWLWPNKGRISSND